MSKTKDGMRESGKLKYMTNNPELQSYTRKFPIALKLYCVQINTDLTSAVFLNSPIIFSFKKYSEV